MNFSKLGGTSAIEVNFMAFGILCSYARKMMIFLVFLNFTI